MTAPASWTVVAGWSRAHILRSPDWTLCGRHVGPVAVTLYAGTVPDKTPCCGQCQRRTGAKS